MPLLQTDDPARYFREVWLGAKGFMRWPVDARFGMWGLAFVLWPVSFGVLWFMAPPVTLVLLAVYVFARWVKRNNPSRARVAWIAGGLIGALTLSLYPHAQFWLFPMPWWLAGILAPAVAVFITGRIAPYVDLNVPLGYRVSLLFNAANRPRRTREVREYAPADELLVVGDGIDLNNYRKLSLVKEIR